ncbi:DUF4263 domain-containing protein [Paraburkholderia bryophila]|uniref:Shedu anti-phage system protein SduA domain-containing protein n=1 Tax=Paraburkholderia bryophila TaxID=420952 RepID=UPI00234B210E|nr:Shedu anti-phage system protein SduA domain-containing protein [Paraburkholderia bryophila]WCM19785.1 DUF4263 domain-containing protein [Paraburkholderia bryophila]
MALPIDQKLIDEFEAILVAPPPAGRQKEQYVQDFMEEHSELIPTPNLLHHGLNFNCVLSKFALGFDEIPDWVMLSKRSDRWLCTIIELKRPEAQIFSKTPSSTKNTSDFEAALDQIRGNSAEIEKRKDDIRDRLAPLLKPINMSQNRIDFSQVLIYGRSTEKNISEARKERYSQRAAELKVELMTYDTVVDAYRRNARFKKNILHAKGKQFAFKRLEHPVSMFRYLTPGELVLSSDQETSLINEGYEIASWKNGKLLDGDAYSKTVGRSMAEEIDDIMEHFHEAMRASLARKANSNEA